MKVNENRSKSDLIEEKSSVGDDGGRTKEFLPTRSCCVNKHDIRDLSTLTKRFTRPIDAFYTSYNTRFYLFIPTTAIHSQYQMLLISSVIFKIISYRFIPMNFIKTASFLVSPVHNAPKERKKKNDKKNGRFFPLTL